MMRRLLSALAALVMLGGIAYAQPPAQGASPGLAPVTISSTGGTLAATFTCETDGIGVTSTDGCILKNATPAAVGAQQWSPRLRFTGSGWKTNATAGPQTVDWIVENQPVQEAASPIGRLVFSHQTNGGGYTAFASLFGNVTGLDVGTTNIAALQLIVGSAGSGSIGPLTGSDHINITRGGTSGVTIGFGAFNSGADLGQIGLGLNGFSNTNPTYTSLSSAYATAFGTGDATGSNIAGGNTTVYGGRSTGSAAGGDVLIQTTIAGGSSSTANTLGTRWTFKGTGGLFSGNASGGDKGADTINLATNQPLYVNGVGRIFNVAAAFTTAANTNLQTITGLSWTLPANVQMNVPFSCKLVWQQGTAAVVVSFGFQTDTVTPTSFLALGQMETNLTTVSYADTTIANTTATVVVSGTPAATATTYNAYLDGFLENPSNGSTTTVNVMVKTATAADAVTISRGSFCRVF